MAFPPLLIVFFCLFSLFHTHAFTTPISITSITSRNSPLISSSSPLSRSATKAILKSSTSLKAIEEGYRRLLAMPFPSEEKIAENLRLAAIEAAKPIDPNESEVDKAKRIKRDKYFAENQDGINYVMLVGRLGSTPVAKVFESGNAVVNVSLAVKRKYHPAERLVRGIKYGDEGTTWQNLEIWGPDAIYLGKYIRKGTRIGVIGSMGVDSWVDKVTGKNRTKFKVMVREVEILETRAEIELREGGGGGREGRDERRGGGYDEDDEYFDQDQEGRE